MEGTRKYNWLLIVGLISLLPCFPFLLGYFPAVGDMRDVFIPLETFFHTEELQGHIPAWNPAVSFGYPVIASAQIGFFYPILLLLRLLPIWLELPLVVALHAVALSIGTALFARKLGMSKYAAVCTAISFSLSQYVWQHETHLNIFLALAWFPWQMLVVNSVFQRKKIYARNIALLVILFGVPFLIGQLQIPFFMMLVALVYGIYLFLSPLSRESWRGAGRVLTATIIIILGTIGLCAIQLFPTAELARLSSRGASGSFNVVQANQFSYPLYHLPTLLFPRFYGNDATYWGKRLEIEYGFYIGIIPLLLAVWYFISKKWKKSPQVFFIVLGIVSFLLSLGSLSPFRLLGIEPSLWIFSAPSRWLLFTTFALSIFAGFGFDALQKNKKSFVKFVKIASGIIFAGIIISNTVLYIPAITNPITVHSEKLQSMLASAKTSSVSLTSPYTWLVIITLLALLLALRSKKYKEILIFLTVIDLAIIAGTSTPNISWNSVLTPPATVQQLPDDVKNRTARIYTIWKDGDTGAYFTDPSSRATLRDRTARQNLLVPMISSQFGIYGVEWPASLDITDETNQTSQLRQDTVINLDLAKQLNIEAILKANTDNAILIQKVDAKPRVELEHGNATIISETASTITIKTSSTELGTLILRDAWYPNWHAFVDGNEVSIIKSPLFFRSIQVPAGDHVVLMKYRQKTIRIGGFISLLTMLILLPIVARNGRIKP